MNRMNAKNYKRILETKRAELLSSRHDWEGIAVERVPDSTDEITLEVERHLVVEALSRDSTLLRQVTEALERIARGKFGVCLVCEEEISPKRLAALPWAALCLECQQAAESRQGAETRASAGLRLGFSVPDEVQPVAESDSGNGHRFRRPAFPRTSAQAGAGRQAFKSSYSS